MAGCSAAYFLREIFGDELAIVVFEKAQQVGGRVQRRAFAGTAIETGATLIHFVSDTSGTYRIERGGAFNFHPSTLAAFSRYYWAYNRLGDFSVGFRLALVPEPSTGLLVMAGLLGLGAIRRAR
jgi:protoporphyrinogen oxidase